MEVKDYKTICLSLPLDLPGGELLSPGRGPPVLAPTMATMTGQETPMFNFPFLPCTVGSRPCERYNWEPEEIDKVYSFTRTWSATTR